MEREAPQQQLKNEEPIQANQAAQEEHRGNQRFEGAHGGNVPAVKQETLASNTEGPENENVAELKSKIAMMVAYRFNGSYKEAFEHYGSNDGQVDKGSLRQLLADAGVGNGMTRGAWVKGIMDKLDVTKDGKISWQEFEAVVSLRDNKTAA